MKPFPHRYTSTITRVGHSIATVEAPPRPALSGGPPPELDGDPHAWSPEHLLVSAIGLCLFATFESFAARENLEISHWSDTTTGVLDRTSSGLAFKSFTIEVGLTVAPADLDRARALLERAHRHCIISKALSLPVKLLPHICSHEVRPTLASA